MALDFSTLSPEEQVTAIFVGYFNRAPAVPGLQQYVADLANGQSLADVARSFVPQQETLNLYPSLASDTISEADAIQLVTDIFNNVFNRTPSNIGPDNFWVQELLTTGVEVGQVVLNIMSGAQGNDLAVLTNKIDVGVTYTEAAIAANDDGTGSLKGTILDNVDETQASVVDAVAQVEAAFPPANPGEARVLTGTTDNLVGTSGDDQFEGYLAQNAFSGGVSNSLSSADRLDGAGGNDTLYAELTTEFVGSTSNGVIVDVQPRMTSIERVELEARDMGNNGVVVNQTVDIDISGDNQQGGDLNNDGDVDIGNGEDFFEGEQFNEFSEGLFGEAFDIDQEADIPEALFTPVAAFDGKNSFGVNEIGSVNSDGDLLIENLNTKVNRDDAVGRKTGDMTIIMDHTDNFNSDGDAADLVVYFDENYLLANDPIQSGAQLTIELMDLDAETLGQDPLLDNPFGKITFNFGGESKELDFGTASNTYAELLADIQAAITAAAATDPDFAQLSASFGPDFTVRDTDNDPDPARPPLTGTTIVIENSGPEVLEAVTMEATGTQPAGKDFHTGFDNEAPEEENFKIEVDIDLHKVGRGGEGGNLIIGGKDQSIGQGIHVFNVDVLGAGEDDPDGKPSKPSNLGVLTSTNGDLQVVNIETHEDYVAGATHASLTIREGFGDNEDLMMVNANDFLGDLTLGNVDAVEDLDTLTALGGGDITFFGELTGSETDQNYVYLTGTGEDAVSVTIFGDSLDYANSGLEIKTGDGNDAINVDFAMVDEGPSDLTNEQLNQAVLDSVDINGEAGDDIINVDGIGNANIHGGSGNDIIYTDGDAALEWNTFSEFPSPSENSDNAIWAFNFDNDRVDDQDPTQPNIDILPEDLPGVQTSLAYLDGAIVTVTLSGAGIGDPEKGGGVMSLPPFGAIQGEDGYESSVTISDLINGNSYYGDQRDVNAAVIAAIEGDAVLNALLSVTIAANNTLVVTSKTSGDFDATDLRIDIEHGTADDSAYANSVLAEARSLFSDSSLTLTDLWGGDTFESARSYETDGSAPGAVFGDSQDADDWYDGLSIEGDDNQASDNLHTRGGASESETDNVINGGSGDDIIVLSTDAVANETPSYLEGGLNAMINGASNETIEVDGMFGDDTIMNFTTADVVRVFSTSQDIVDVTEGTDGTDPTFDPEGNPESFDLVLNGSIGAEVAPTATAYTVTFDTIVTNVPAGTSPVELGALIEASYLTESPSGWTAVDNGDGTVTFTNTGNGNIDTSGLPDVTVAGDWDSSTPEFEDNADIANYVEGVAPVIDSPGTPEVVELTFSDVTISNLTDNEISIAGTTYFVSEGDLAEDIAAAVAAAPPAGWTAVDNGSGVVTLTAIAVGDQDTPAIDDDIAGLGAFNDDVVAPGLDFLDFTSYLTSLEDNSVNGAVNPDSDDSHVPIPVTLDFDLDDVQANEVSVVQFIAGGGDTFAGLTEEVLEALFNTTDAANNHGNLTVAANADDEYAEPVDGTDPLVAGAAKSIVMVEDGGNLGHYKVFELSWNGDASNDEDSSLDGVVDAKLVGSMDFGTSLDGLQEVNLVGSDDYNTLNTVGIQNFGFV